MSISATSDEFSAAPSRIGDSFGIAAWITILGVCAAWWFLKSAPAPEAPQSFVSTSVLSRPMAQPQREFHSNVDQGDLAFASGDIVSPPGDNALHYYQLALAETPDDAGAQRGLGQVLDYLLNDAESAIFHGDFDLAREHAAKVLHVVPEHTHAADINARAVRLQRIEELLNRAVALYGAGQLAEPVNENAAALYQRVLELEPGNETARQGLDAVAQRLVGHAESAMFAGDAARAQIYLNQVKAINPNAPGLSMLARTEQTIQETRETREIQQTLAAAADALQSNRLMPPAEPNAYQLYRSVLDVEPQSAAALRGLDLVRTGLLDQARAKLAGNDPQGALAQLDAAANAGASTQQINELRADASYRQRLLDAQAGRFDRLFPISELEPLRQNPPNYPRNAPRGASGTVELQMTVSEIGDVRDIEVLGNPLPQFQRAAVQAVNGWRFKPVIEQGNPIPVRVAVRVSFAAE